MNVARPICLIGMPGGGKSTVGRRLAKRLQLGFFDSDGEIARHTSRSIADWFQAEGEAAFRRVESETLLRLVDAGPAVIATGGGAVLSEENRTLLRERTLPVYLHAVPEDLWRRVANNPKRPLLQVADPYARLVELFEQRHPLYDEVALCRVEAGRGPAEETVERIVAAIDAIEAAP